MKFKLRNIGIVEFADIEIKGLTVLTGLNDIGKSFISKSIYSSIKTIKESSNHERNEKTHNLDVIWINIRTALNNLKKAEISSLFDLIILPLRNDILLDLSNKTQSENIIKKIKVKQAEFLDKGNFTTGALQTFNIFFEQVIKILNTDRKEEEIRMGYFDRIYIQQLFRSQINNVDNIENKNNQVIISLEDDGGSENFKLVVENNKSIEFKVNNDTFSLTKFNDATIIDSPIIIQMQNLILKNRLETNRIQDPIMPSYYLDLVSKFIPLGNPNSNDVYEQIQKIIKGSLKYDPKTNKISYLKNNGSVIDGINIATGIKSFGILQLLLNSGSINPNSILIIDEPEVHLHPQWIVEYAKIIVLLCLADIPILISSHSPYLIEKLSEYSSVIQDKTNFYFGEVKPDGRTSFTNVSDNLNPIFKALAEPMRN